MIQPLVDTSSSLVSEICVCTACVCWGYRFAYNRNSHIFPLIFSVSVHFPLFPENYYFPYFDKFPPVLEKFTCFLHAFSVFSFPPYFDHDAFMHHPMHVLDAPGVWEFT